ncbi:alpha/beta fold hydrolase [Flavobacterium jejuense]|uniref:Alpha/beta fold hydrolase n=1 Tax=Flavobacterium jejuense TaxID=1544455 RepID=A0ABX0IUU5_9FLAO|nr:alpha/beta fold hydrolase [Flavobacterium jejuense]NHN26308.1 alpha/beta fold hydrolase [Flavobacterium jejuense]
MIFSKIEGKGKPFLIIHGFLGMSDNWKTLGSQFSENGFEMHLLDMRNHGRSFQSEEFNYDVMVEDVLKYCKFNKLDEIVLLGHSMGGKVAMQFACMYPEYVSKLVIADIGPKYYAPHHQTILEGLSAIDFNLKPSRGEVDAILTKYISDFGTRQFLLKNLYWVEPGQLDFRFNLKVLIDTILEIGRELPDGMTFDKKVLFLRGSNSNYILDEDFDTIKKVFPNNQIVTIFEAGHWLHAEQPKEFYSNVMNFLN